MANQFITMELRPRRDVKIFPQHEEILSNFKVQLKNQVRFTSLKILCARKVADLWPTYYVDQGLTRLSSILPKTLCRLVLQELLEPDKYRLNNSYMRNDYREYNAALEQKLYWFFGDGLEEVDCRMLNEERTLAQRHYQYQQMFKQLAKGSPKLRSLKDRNYLFCNTYNNKGDLSVYEYYNLNKMSNLVILEVNISYVDNSDLLIIGLCLPLLQRLLLKFDPSVICTGDLKHLTKLKLLKHFTAEVRDHQDEASVQLVNYCLKLMPKVNIVGTSRRDLYFVVHDIPSYGGPVELALEHLVLGENTVIPSNVTLPHVTRVTVYDSLTVSLKQFKKLQYLCCVSLPWSQLEQTLADVGHDLKTLKPCWKNYNLLQVLQLCPNLEELVLIGVQFLDSYHSFQLKNWVKNLKIFKHDIDDMEQETLLDSRGLLHLLLTSCPDLEELLFSGVRLTKAEMDLITADMANGAFAIQKLKKIYIMAVVEKEAYVSFAEFARYVCEQNFKVLKKVHINERWLLDRKNEDLPEMNLALKMQYYINIKHQLVKN